MFNLENSIKTWLRRFQKYKAFNHGSIREMELHIRDHIDDLITQGLTEEEAFHEATKEFGEIKTMATEEYWNLRPTSKYQYIIALAMFNNYFKIAIRNFWKHKFYAFANIVGLTIGLTIVFMISLFITDELSFDHFHHKKDNLYRVVENQYYAGQPVFPVAVTPTALGPSLTEEYPEVLRFTRVGTDNDQFVVEGEKIQESGGIAADKGFFEMFTFPVVKGSVASFSDQVNTLVLNEELAEKYFPGQDPIGRQLTLGKEEYIVAAVIANAPKNSHLSFRYIRNFENYLARNPNRVDNWGNNWLYTYVELEPSADLNTVNEKIIGQIKANDEGSVTDIYLQPLTDIYLGEVDFTAEVSTKGVKLYVQIFGVVALFILLISCINFMNLSTARSAKRSKEVGLRKAIGAFRAQLVIQFLSESILLSIISLVLSIGLIALILPSFNALASKEFALSMLLEPDFGIKIVALVVTTALFTGLLAGSYPAIYLSSIKPILALNAQVVKGKQGAVLRKLLVILQFTVSVILIIGTVVIYKQLEYIQNVDLGYNRNNIIYTFARGEQAETFANELRKQSEIVNVGRSNRHPGYVLSSTSGLAWPGQDPEETILIHYMSMDENYIPAMEMKISEGRAFSNSDTTAVIINRKAQEIMGLDDPVGQIVTAYTQYKYRIVGVVEDFNFKSIHTAIEPIIIFKSSDVNRIYIRYKEGSEAQALQTVRDTWNKFYPDQELDYYFLDDDFSEMYDAEARTTQLSTYFAIMAIIISCLGLFGLVSYAVEQRTREVGIRKVLGASVRNLFLLLTNDFVKLVIISLFISIPVAWYLMHTWLGNFAYRIELSVWMFVISAAMAMLVAILTVSYQSVRAAISNPVNALRDN